MKKIKFTFWLLGFGCGIALTGIVGTFCALNIEVGKEDVSLGTSSLNEQESSRATKSPQPEISVMSSEPVEETAPSKKNDALMEQSPSGIPKDEQFVEEIGIGESQAPKEREVAYKSITISQTAGASEICKQLEEEGFIEDADAFLAYIKSLKKQRFLKHGELLLPLNVDYERLLEELTV